jgi:hypothetical protein
VSKTTDESNARVQMSQAIDQLKTCTDKSERARVLKIIRTCAKVLHIDLAAAQRKAHADLRRDRKAAALKLTRERR